MKKDDIEITEDNPAVVSYKEEPLCTFPIGESNIWPAGQDRPVPLSELRAILAKLEKLTVERNNKVSS